MHWRRPAAQETAQEITAECTRNRQAAKAAKVVPQAKTRAVAWAVAKPERIRMSHGSGVLGLTNPTGPACPAGVAVLVGVTHMAGITMVGALRSRGSGDHKYSKCCEFRKMHGGKTE